MTSDLNFVEFWSLLDGWPEKTAFIASRVGIIGVFRKFHKLDFDGRRQKCHLRSGVRNRHYLKLSIFWAFRGRKWDRNTAYGAQTAVSCLMTVESLPCVSPSVRR